MLDSAMTTTSGYSPKRFRVFIRLFAVGVLTAASMLVLPMSAHAATTLQAGQTLYGGSELSWGDYRMAMQTDGNLVVYWGGSNAIWSPMLYAPGSRLVMQTDGNLVVYRPDNVAIWSTNTLGSGADRVIMQNDGNLVLYRANGTYAWESHTRGFDYDNFGGSIGKPNNIFHSWYNSGALPSSFNAPFANAMANLDSQTEFVAVAASGDLTADVSASYYSKTNNFNYAETSCVKWNSANTTLCDRHVIWVNPAFNHPDKQALMCHEIGHTVLQGHGPPGVNNSYLLPLEQSCMRGNPDVRAYGIRNIALINLLY